MWRVFRKNNILGNISSIVQDVNLFYLDFLLSLQLYRLASQCILLLFISDDGTGPDKIAHIMGPPDQCQHAASIITELLQSIRAREEGGQGVGTKRRRDCFLRS